MLFRSFGYLGTGWWFSACTTSEHTRWPLFWGGLTLVIVAVLIYFLLAYQDTEKRLTRTKTN